MDQTVRNKLRNVVTQCRKVLEDATAQTLQGRFGIYAGRKKGEVQIEEEVRMGHLTEEDRACRRELIEHLNHIQALGYKLREALDQLVREIAFTHLNRLCAYKMMEARGLIREAVSRGVKSQGFLFYLADHPDDEKLHKSGRQDEVYRHFLDWLGGTLSEEIGALFHPNDPANRIYPPQRILDAVLALINSDELKTIWTEDETIGWVYQYFTPKELRDKARKESQAPRNSYELAFRNQFFTPRYVVEFLTDNTLGRIWYEMRKGETSLKDRCRYLVRWPVEIFLNESEEAPAKSNSDRENLSQDELLNQPAYIPHRPKKDPRKIKILDPACGSGHFLLYCFDLLQIIYEEAYADPELSPALKRDYSTLDELRRAVPGLILKYNLHGIDIDLRATQIAALALWLRCQRAYQDLALPNGERPKITRSNIVCAEPMPGETDLLKEFTATLQPKVLGQLVEVVFEKMKLAREAGSLLKIEDEIKEVVATARLGYQTEMKQLKDETAYLPGMAPPRGAMLFDFADMSDEAFLDKADGQIIAALRWYAEKAANGKVYLRRLFAEDTTRGLAFVDVCHQEYDVVLMNPPFGDAPSLIRPMLAESFPCSKNDIGMAFIDRYVARLTKQGLLGAITARTFVANETLQRWRAKFLLGDDGTISSMADLGIGVLDEALVETAAYVIRRASLQNERGIFIRLLNERGKEEALTSCFPFGRSLVHGRTTIHLVPITALQQVPGQCLCYWIPLSILTRLLGHSTLKSAGGVARQGLITGDDFMFLRASWEVDPAKIGRGKQWVPYAKGGEYQPFYDDIHLIVEWANDGDRIRNFVGDDDKPRSRPQGISYFYKGGLTYPERTTSDFSPRVLPRDVIFSGTGQGIFLPNRNSELLYLAGGYTRIFKLLVDALVGGGDSSVSGSAAKHYRAGVIQSLPHPLPEAPAGLAAEVAETVVLCQEEFSSDETSRTFTIPAIVSDWDSAALCEAVHTATAKIVQRYCRILTFSKRIDDLATDSVFRLSVSEKGHLDILIGPHPQGYSSHEMTGDEIGDLWVKTDAELSALAVERLGARRQLTKKAFFANRRLELIAHVAERNPSIIAETVVARRVTNPEDFITWVKDVISYCVGCTVGRWDIRLATGEHQTPPLPDPFDPLPVCPPGMLQGPQALPAKPEDVPAEYPLQIDWDGILVDDPGHSDDIVRRVRDVLEVIWKNRAEAIEKEVCEILGVRKLRDYFRKPGNGGFWMDHVKRYSKSRRKAPIYWYLRSVKGNYGLWLYYHRLDKDILFKALLNYVEPKIRLEEDRLNTLRSRKRAAGSSSREAKQIERKMDRQEQFVSELHDFKDKLCRAADLHITPDLNDGVALNIAPLWELVPWKEAKRYWEELHEGKYDWAHIALELWPARVKEKCRMDRSIAIAHGQEHLCKIPPLKVRRAAADAEAPNEDQGESGEEYTDDEAV
jgi:hypothetical protein